MSNKALKYLENDSNANWIVLQLCEAKRTGFYGKITVQFEAGNIVIMRKEQTMKPPATEGDNGKEEIQS